MKSSIVLLALAMLGLAFLQGCVANETNAGTTAGGGAKTLTLVTYDGFNSEYGLGRVLIPKFESQCNCTVRVLASGDVGWVAAKALMQKQEPDADVVLGIDNSYRPAVSGAGLFEEYEPKNYGLLNPDANDGDLRFVPYDYGFIALMYDSEKVSDYPKSLEEMTDGRFARSIALPSPLSSSTGRAFAFWAAAEYGNATGDYFARLRPSLLAVTPGWTEAYGMFTSGEAPYVISYTTSPAYHLAFENSTRYRAVLFPRMYRQVEYVSVLSSAREKGLARQFVDFMLSPEAQAEIPLGNFMYPSVDGTPLPEAFSVVEYPKQVLGDVEDAKWLDVWKKAYGQ